MVPLDGAHEEQGDTKGKRSLRCGSPRGGRGRVGEDGVEVDEEVDGELGVEEDVLGSGTPGGYSSGSSAGM